MLHDHDNSGHIGFNLPYKVAALLKIVMANRSAHIATYNRAVKAYRQAYRDECMSAVSKIDACSDFHHGTELSKPNCYTKEYDRSIDMLKMTTAKSITLTPDLFRQLVRDEWSWSNEWASNSVRYATAGG